MKFAPDGGEARVSRGLISNVISVTKKKNLEKLTERLCQAKG